MTRFESFFSRYCVLLSRKNAARAVAGDLCCCYATLHLRMLPAQAVRPPRVRRATSFVFNFGFTERAKEVSNCLEGLLK